MPAMRRIRTAFERVLSPLVADIGERWGDPYASAVFPELMEWYIVADRPARSDRE